MTTADPPRPPSARATFWKRRSTRIGLVLLALAVLVRALLPIGARMAIERYGGDALGRRVEVADIDFGLLMGRAAVEGIAVGGPDRVAPIAEADKVVSCARIGAQIAWLPLVTGKVHLREIALLEPSVRLERNPDGSLAPLVLAPPAPPEPEPPKEEEGGGLDLAIDRLSLDAAGLALVRHSDQAEIAELRFENFTLGDLTMQEGVFGIGDVSLRGPDLQVQQQGLEEPGGASAPEPAPRAAPAAAEPAAAPAPPPRHRVKDLNIESAKFVWHMPDGEAIDTELELHAQNLGIGAERFPFDLRVETDKAEIGVKGEVALQPVSFEGTLRWQGLLLPRLAKLAPDAPVAVEAGRSDGELQISLRLEDAPDAPAALHLKGKAGVANLDVATRDGAATVKWKQLDTEIESFVLPLGEQPGALEVQLAKLALAKPEVTYQLAPAPAGEAPPAETPAPEAEPVASAPPPRARIEVLTLDDGSVRFRDTSPKPPVETGLESLRVRARGVRWPERDIASLLLTAKGARGSTLKIEGGVKGGAGDIAVALSQWPLSPFDPYAGQATGLKIDQGRLSLDAKLALGPQRLGAKSKISLHQLAVSERESGWFQKSFGVPLNVAIALLQDLEGNITLPVDVEQNESGTSVSVAAAVGAALRQALVGALAAPLKLLGSMAGAGGAAVSTGLEPIPMAAGRAELPADADERLAALAKLLASRPGLRVLLLGRAGSEDDPVLARQTVVARAKADQPLAGEEAFGIFERRRVRRALADADPAQLDTLDEESTAALAKLSAAVVVDAAARQQLAMARAEQVQRALQERHGAPAERVAVEAETGSPAVVIELNTQ